MSARVLKIKDPLLGWCWTVDCPWHGIRGRYDTQAQAQAALDARHVDCGEEA